MSPRRLKNISCKYLWLFENTPRKWFRVISVGLLKLPYKVDVGPLDTLSKLNILWEQCIAINHLITSVMNIC